MAAANFRAAIFTLVKGAGCAKRFVVTPPVIDDNRRAWQVLPNKTCRAPLPRMGLMTFHHSSRGMTRGNLE